jgi:hypothetical protein
MFPALLAAALLAPTNAKLPDAVEQALKSADAVEVWSIDPSQDAKPPDGFHGYKILGKTIVKGDDASKAVAAVLQAVADSDGTEADCFEPRHGLRVTRDDKTYDLVICFHCQSIQVYAGDKMISAVPTTRSAAPVLDKILKDAGVPLAPKADK